MPYVARLRRELSEGLSVSVGAAGFPDECATVEQLLAKAERPPLLGQGGNSHVHAAAEDVTRPRQPRPGV